MRKLILALALFGLVLPAHAADQAPPYVKANPNPFAGYIAGRCGFYVDLNAMGGAGSLNGTTVPGASVIQGAVGGGVGYGCPLGSTLGSFWFAQADFDWANLNGAANGLALTGPAHFEQMLAIGGPLASILQFLPGNPFSGIASPATPACPATVTCGPQYGFVFGSLHEQDVGAQLPGLTVAANKAWLVSPGIGIGLESRWSNQLVVDVTTELDLQSTGVGIGTQNVKFGNAWLTKIAFKY